MSTSFATAEQLILAVYSALTAPPQQFDETPDNVQFVIINDWSLRIIDDTDEQAPHGLSWWIDSPQERGVDSDGWESLPADQVDTEAVKLAALIERRAGVAA